MGMFKLFALGLSLLFVTACATAPKKSRPLPVQSVQDLKSMPLPKKLPIPVEGIKRNQLTDTWGAARSTGRRHEGIDILAPRGTVVKSATHGVVGSLQSNKLGGNVVWILGPSGSWHYYAHLDKQKRGLNVGDRVRPGDVIGYVGNSGNARYTASHLHYGIYLTGRGRGAVNPYPYVHGDF